MTKKVSGGDVVEFQWVTGQHWINIMDTTLNIPNFPQILSQQMYSLGQYENLCDLRIVAKDGMLTTHRLAFKFAFPFFEVRKMYSKIHILNSHRYKQVHVCTGVAQL